MQAQNLWMPVSKNSLSTQNSPPPKWKCLKAKKVSFSPFTAPRTQPCTTQINKVNMASILVAQLLLQT